MVFTLGKSQLQYYIFSSLKQDMSGMQDDLDTTSSPAIDFLYLSPQLTVCHLAIRKEEMVVW